jgi:GNAT superfamily N-acetyltransferase
VLRNGERVLLRPAHHRDASALQGFFAALSPRSRLLRFHGGVSRLPDAVARSMSTQVARRHVALVALAGEGVLCAEARYAIDAGGDTGSAEFGLAVADYAQGQGQGQGLGRALLLRLAVHARESGVHTLTGSVMPGNEAEVNEPELDLPAEIQRREQRLAAIQQARERVEQRQREAALERGRSHDDDRRPRGPDGQSRGGRYKREFGVPEAKAQENFTDPDSRIMKRAGGGFDPAYNAQTAVDEAAHIIVAAELDNVAPDANWLLPMIQAVGDNLGELPELGLADAGYRSEDNLKNAPIEVVVALGREGKVHAEVDAERYPHTAAMAAKLQTKPGQAAYRKRKWIAEPPNGWIKNVLGFRQFSTGCGPSGSSCAWR